MSREKQIEEIYEVLTRDCDTSCVECKFDRLDLCVPHHKAEALYNAGYRKQIVGEWNDECTVSTTAGLNLYSHGCSNCSYHYKSTTSVGYNYCPYCGAKMKGGE